MDQRERAGQPLVAQVEEEVAQLHAGQHPLVDQGAARQRREVDRSTVTTRLGPAAPRHRSRPRARCACAARRRGARGPCPTAARRPRGRRRTGGGSSVRRRGPSNRSRSRRRAPRANRRCAAPRRRRSRRPPWRPRRPRSGSWGRKASPDRVGARLGQREVAHLAQERVGDLDQDAGAVTDVVLGAGRAAVVEVVQGGQAPGDHLVAATAVHVDDEGDAAGVVLERRVVQPLAMGRSRAMRTRTWVPPRHTPTGRG